MTIHLLCSSENIFKAPSPYNFLLFLLDRLNNLTVIYGQMWLNIRNSSVAIMDAEKYTTLSFVVSALLRANTEKSEFPRSSVFNKVRSSPTFFLRFRKMLLKYRDFWFVFF